MKVDPNNTGKIIIPTGLKPSPRWHEIKVAKILAVHFRTNVEFILTSKRTTPDFLINGVEWELKSPQGTGKNNIQRQLQQASHQSRSVIIYAGRSKMHATKIRREVEHQFKIIKSIKRLIFISKDSKVVEFFR
ncbi:MAG TPA: hypothetical protein PKC86_00505 [Candidatus Saccharibacteria bacterium]|nr:hypothetical protein [Candidatus Saccharibacteria bacterium]